VYAWGASPSKYVQDALANVEQYLALHYQGRRLKNKFSGPWQSGYTSELDETPELDAEQANSLLPVSSGCSALDCGNWEGGYYH